MKSYQSLKRLLLLKGFPTTTSCRITERSHTRYLHYFEFTVVALCQNLLISKKEVPHVHFHVIPKPAATPEEGLSIGWPAKSTSKEELQSVLEELKAKLNEGGSVL